LQSLRNNRADNIITATPHRDDVAAGCRSSCVQAESARCAREETRGLCLTLRAHPPSLARLQNFQPSERVMAYKFEIYKDKAGEFRFRFKASNGEKVFASEGYKSKASAKSTIKSIVKHVGKAEIDDVSKAVKAKTAKKAKKAKKKKSKK
jgi:uncharacterized protein YegP (UPF0339 family)